jgi:heme exporter protein B
MSAFLTLLKRDLTLALREGGALGTALGFYLIVVALMPLGLGPDLNLLSRIAPGVLWIALLLSALLSLPRMFESDHDDGTLELITTGTLPLELATVAKALAHWTSTGIPLILATPLMGLLLNLDVSATPILLASLIIGTPAVSFLGSVGAALTLRARRGGLLIALLVLPLFVPTLIFGIQSISAVTLQSGSATASLMALAAVTLASLVLGPIAAAAAIRAQLE